MKLGIISHCTIDTIVFNDIEYDVAGGPACYCAFTAKNQKFDVDIYTKFGPDFPLRDKLDNFNILTPAYATLFFNAIKDNMSIVDLSLSGVDLYQQQNKQKNVLSGHATSVALIDHARQTCKHVRKMNSQNVL